MFMSLSSAYIATYVEHGGDNFMPRKSPSFTKLETKSDFKALTEVTMLELSHRLAHLLCPTLGLHSKKCVNFSVFYYFMQLARLSWRKSKFMKMRTLCSTARSRVWQYRGTRIMTRLFTSTPKINFLSNPIRTSFTMKMAHLHYTRLTQVLVNGKIAFLYIFRWLWLVQVYRLHRRWLC